MAAHWASATFTGYDGEGRAGILYEAADLVEGMQYLGIVDDCNYLTGLKGTAISPGSPKGTVMLPPEYAGKTITLNLCGGAIVPNALLDTISVYVPPKEIVPDGQRVFHAAASPMRHITPWGAIGGVVMGDALVHTTACDYNHHIVWGPYETLPAGEYIATFQLKVPNNTSSNQAFLIDVTRDAGVIITSKGLKYTDFKAAMEWQTVSLEFKLGAETKKMEYRVAPGVGHPLYVGTITRRKKPVEPPPECAQEIIIRFADDPEKVADIFYTIKGGTPNIPAKSATQFTIQCPANQTVRINVGVTEDTIDSFTDFYACTAEVLEVPLLVAAPPGEAFLTLTVVDKDDLPIEGATVTVDGATGTTDASGIYKTTAVIGTELTVTVTKEGYESGTLTDTMLEGGLPIKIMLVKIGELITQLIIVKKAGDFQAEYIEGATVTVDGKACEELPDGLYSIEIEEGIEATVEVKAEGYKDKTEAFTTTSMASLLISLEPSIPEGESEQAFTLVDADGNPIEGATITVGEESCVTDSEGKCVITAPIGEATTATITKPGYEDTEMAITPGEDGDEYSVTLPRAEEILTLPPGVKGDLDAGTVSDEIKDAFAAAGIPLSDEATIEKIDAGSWKVTDGEDVYSVLEEEGELNVYPGGGTPAPPGPPTPPPGEPKWDFVEFDTWVDDSNKARIKYKGLDLISGTEYHGVFEVMFPPEVRVGTLINTTTPSGSVDIDATMNEGKTVEIRLYEYASGKPSKIIDRKDVAIPMREEVDQVEVILGLEMLALWQQNPALEVHCDELIDYAWPFLAWFPPMFGFETRKGVTDGKAIFTVADGLVKDKQYIFHMYPQLALEEVLKGNAVKFGYTPSVTLTKTNIMEAAMCPFFGFEPGSVECENEVNEFVDAYYVANTIKKLVTGENLLGEPDTADMFDIIFMPIIMLGAAVPFIPVGKTLKTALGPMVNLIRKADKGAWLAKNQHKIHLALAAGKGASVDEAKKLMAVGKWDEAERLLDNVVTEIHNSPTLSATARENLAGWNAGARKLLDDKPQMKTKIDDLTDEAVGGTIFKTHFDEIVKHFDEAVAAGDWVKAKRIWEEGIAGNVDNLVYYDKNLAKASPEFQRMHNIMRFSKIDYVDALADANRLSTDLDFMARHLSEAGEPYNYITVWKALDATEQANVVGNIGQTGRKDLAKIIDLLGADTTKGTKVHANSVKKKLDDLGEMTEDEVRATNKIVGDEADQAAKSATTAEKAAAEKVVVSDDAVKHPKMARLWAYVHRHPKTAKLMEETGTTSFKKLPIWAKVSVIGVVFMGISSVWHKMMDFCMALFMGEETIQWAGFGGIVLNSLTYDWDEKPLSERKELIATFKEFRDLRGGIHDTVIKTSGVFETLCLIFGDIYKNFWEADAISLWALDKKIEDMEKGIDPLSGIGECTLLASADKKGVAFYVHGETKKYHSGAAYDVVKVPDVLVRDEEYKVVLCAEKDGYVLGIQQIRITRDDIGEKISTPTFELIPDSDIGVSPFSGLPYTDEEYDKYATKPTKYGKIICSTNPTGAKIFLDGEYQDVDTNWTLDYVPVGLHKVTFKLDGYFDCEKVVNVAIEPHAQAYCILESAEGSIRCKRMDIDHYNDRAADLFYKKHADVDWIKNPQSAPTDGGVEYIEDLEVGAEYDVKYNFLNVLECINGEVLTIPPNVPVDCDDCQLASRLPREITTTVTEVIDGDSFRTVYTDALPRRPYGAELLPQEIRIIGCNCFESGSPIGQVAKTKLTELIGGKSVTLKIDSNRPLGVYNRVIAGVFLPDGTDVAIKLMEACVIREYPGDTAKYRYAYYWEPWSYLDAVWARYDPEGNNCIASQDATGKTLISMSVDTVTKTVQMHNRWLPVYAVVRRYDKLGNQIGVSDEYASKAILTGGTSSSYGYYDSATIRLFASVDPITIKNQGVEIEVVIIGEVPPDTYDVTFTSSPPGATVNTIPGTITISRLTSVLKSQRDSTPVSRFYKRQRLK